MINPSTIMMKPRKKTLVIAVDKLFWIASMTKAITSAAAMQLVEQGKLAVDQPIANVLPELSKPQVLDGFLPSGAVTATPALRWERPGVGIGSSPVDHKRAVVGRANPVDEAER